MDILGLTLISISLAMDCFAVSFSAGASQRELKFKNALIIALFFGLFQGGMSVIGWFAGAAVVEKISRFDHWLAFVILAFIGGKMIWEALGKENGESKKEKSIMHFPTLLLLSIATSLDALAVGFSFAMVNVNIRLAGAIIALGSFIFPILGVYGGKKLANVIKPKYAEIAGGIILIGIGLKTLIGHLSC